MFYNLKGHLINISNVRNAYIWLATNIRIEFNCGNKDYLTISCKTTKEAQEVLDDFIKYVLSMEK